MKEIAYLCRRQNSEQMNQETAHIYSSRLKDLSRGIISPVRLISPDSTSDLVSQAIWDTGATFSCVSARAAKLLKLIPHREAFTNTMNGPRKSVTSILLSFPGNQRFCTWVEATQADVLPHGCDMLIGLDIISLGDFRLRHIIGGLLFEFEFSADRFIDYENDNAEATMRKIAEAYRDILTRT